MHNQNMEAEAWLPHRKWVHLKHQIKHFAYSGGRKKLEPMWNVLINTGGLSKMLPLLEAILSRLRNEDKEMIPEIIHCF